MSIKLECKIDFTNINKIVKDMQRLGEREVSAGFDDTPHGDGSATNAQIAGYLENGVKNVDGTWKMVPRRFMQQSGHILAESINTESRLVVENTVKGKHQQVNKYLDKVADIAKDSIQESIELQNFAALKPSTLRIKAAKNSPHATEILLDTGELFESIVTEVK